MKSILSNPIKKRTIIVMAVALVSVGLLATGTVWASGNLEVQQVKSNSPSTVTAIPQAQLTQATDADMNVAFSLQNAFRSVSQKVLPVVVEVNVVDVIQQQVAPFTSPFQYFFVPQGNNQQPQTREYRQYGLGSGVMVQRDGNKVYALTNNHVAGEAEEISVKLYDGRQYPAKLVGKDERTDLALVVFETKDNVPLATLGDSSSLMVGDWVIAVGNPLGFESTVTSGIVSAVGRRTEPNQQISGFTDYIQTDAAINEGNSGGALVNLNGEVVGINSWIASPNGGSIGIGFAIPINIAANAIPQFIDKGRIDYGWLGVTIGDADNDMRSQLKLGDETGAFVYGVIKDSPAKKNGIQPGDYITSVGNQAVTDASGLTWMIGNMSPGDNDVINLIRYGEKKSVEVKITARQDEQNLAQQTGIVWPGIAVVTVTGDMRDQYNIPKNAGDLIIAGIDNSGSAAVNGLQRGDIILQVGGTNVHSLLDFYKAINVESGNHVGITVNRGGIEMTFKVTK